MTVSERLRAQFEYLAQRDDLTGILSRRAVLHAGSSELKNRRGGQPLSLLLMDIDHFKRINDQHGHLVGDRVLAHFAQIVGRALRHTDHLGRFGGEEFVVLLPQTGMEAALAMAERVRQAVEQQSAIAGQPACTASLGLASVEAGKRPLTNCWHGPIRRCIAPRLKGAIVLRQAKGRFQLAYRLKTTI